ncbi:long-chain-fatty-acid--CoA ligase [Uliginosibacterium gangwonense]|uniref:long-chain-fatty-acid--CoA ligase n=1 Tax=Uliginosibacterium gangwonense TaxID=392736 RepID=UPI00036175E9|nr:long-chain-fatty-acid--CoA ligase [Uliginosibacterium gangwonense]
MEKAWLASYPPGVPAEVDVARFSSIGALFEYGVERWGDRTAYYCMGGQLSFRQVGVLARQFASYLQNELKLPKGTRIALMMPNVLQYPVSLFGAMLGGYTVVNCNPLYTPRELEHQLKDSGAQVIVIIENFAHTLQKVIDHTVVKHVVVASLGDMLGTVRGGLINFVVRHVKKMVPKWSLPNAVRFNKTLSQGARQAFKPVDVSLQDLAFLQYTGGTTGVAKGAMLRHGNPLANVLQAHAWVQGNLCEGQEVVVTALPLYHIFSLTANCIFFFMIGASNVLIPNPRDIPGFIKELAKYPFTVITGVNTLFNALLNHPDFAKLDFSRLHLSLGGGMATQKAVADRWQQVTGGMLLEAYGLTEASPALCINPVNLKAFNGAIGLPLPSTELSLRDEDGKEVPPGSPGELCGRGPQVMLGYWNAPDETAKVMTEDGFLRTGDVAVMDEGGFFRVVDRKKDIIVVSGFNVYPNEIEDVVATHPGVAEAAVIGVPDAHSGEAVKLFVVRKDPKLTVDDIIRHCKKDLTRYKVPHFVEFRDSLPKTNVGKILRRALRNEVEKG